MRTFISLALGAAILGCSPQQPCEAGDCDGGLGGGFSTAGGGTGGGAGGGSGDGGLPTGSVFDAGALDPRDFQPQSPGHRARACLTLDVGGDALLLIGGDVETSEQTFHTWRFGNGRWTGVSREGPPSGQCTTDLSRRTVVFIGNDDRLYEWNGARWSEGVPLPMVRHEAALSYDAARSRVLRFGGRDEQGTIRADLFTFDGTSWTPVAATPSPEPRIQARLVFDPSQNVTFLVGGLDGANPTPSVWSFDGATWTQRATAPSFRANQPISAGFHPTRQKLVMFTQYLNDADELVGSSFSALTTSGSALAIGEAPSMIPFDGALVFNDVGYGPESNLRLKLQGTAWVPLEPRPQRRSSAAAAWTPLGIIVTGGMAEAPVFGMTRAPANDTWRFDGVTWTKLEGLNSPQGTCTGITQPGTQAAIVLCGSISGYTGLFRFTGTDWAPFDTAGLSRLPNAIAPVEDHVEAIVSGSLWAHRNGAWEEVSNAGLPSDSLLGYDAKRKLRVVVGGRNGPSVSTETRTFDGTTWATQTTPVSCAQFNCTLTWLPEREALGLMDQTGQLWTLTGTGWKADPNAKGLFGVDRMAVAYDPNRHALFTFGGVSRQGVALNQSWWLNLAP